LRCQDRPHLSNFFSERAQEFQTHAGIALDEFQQSRTVNHGKFRFLQSHSRQAVTASRQSCGQTDDGIARGLAHQNRPSFTGLQAQADASFPDQENPKSRFVSAEKNSSFGFCDRARHGQQVRLNRFGNRCHPHDLHSGGKVRERR